MESNKKIIRFEDLEVWKLSMELCKEIFLLTKEMKKYSLIDQMERSSLSIPSNIAEGFERNSDKELMQFFYYAKGSAGELRTQLYIAKELNYITEMKFDEMLIKIKTISSMLYYFIKSKSKKHN